uniref:Uncharacterized protein n=1 Tax=Oryza punctata TaxID=4537 RepID=A0A0E0LSQ6_ORYPU
MSLLPFSLPLLSSLSTSLRSPRRPAASSQLGMRPLLREDLDPAGMVSAALATATAGRRETSPARPDRRSPHRRPTWRPGMPRASTPRSVCALFFGSD